VAKPDCILAVCQWLGFLELGNTFDILWVVHWGKFLGGHPSIEACLSVREVDGSDNLNNLRVLVSVSALEDFIICFVRYSVVEGPLSEIEAFVGHQAEGSCVSHKC
jgi:hypothetical protein